MKKMISNIVLVATVLNTVPAFSYTNSLTPAAQISTTRSSFEILFSNYKKSIMVDGINNEEASREFLDNVMVANISIEEIRGYALKNMSVENFIEFEKTLQNGIMTINGKETSEKKMARLVEKLIEGQQKEGANWISCGTGMAIGLPLLAAGVIAGIVAITMKNIMMSEVEKSYIEKRKEALDNYTTLENDRQDDIVTYESDISAYQNEIAELERRIGSGQYGALEEERMRQEMAALNVSISDSRSAIAQLINNQPQLYNSYQDEIAHLNSLEANEINNANEKNDKNDRDRKLLGITAAVAMPVGLTLILASRKDCK